MEPLRSVPTETGLGSSFIRSGKQPQNIPFGLGNGILRSDLTHLNAASVGQPFPRLNQLRKRVAELRSQRDALTQSQAAQQENDIQNDTDLPYVESLVFFPPAPFTSPIQSVTTPGFRVYAFAGNVSTLLSTNEPSAWVSNRTIADVAMLDDIILNFIYLTHQDCPAQEFQKTSALMYIMLYKPNGNPLLGNGEGWHRDPSPWPCDGHVPTRYAITLLGDSTKILDPEARGKPELGRVMPRIFAGERSAELGQVLRFTMGRVDSPVHAVPAITKDRVFMNVVYGSEVEVRSNRKGIPWME